MRGLTMLTAMLWPFRAMLTACFPAASGDDLAQRSKAATDAKKLSEQNISDAYIYLLGRLFVTNQQQKDCSDGFQWNQLMHRKPGAVDWPNPNLDVAYSEAWVAVDEHAYVLVTVPKISGRYYTVQFLNGWGETLANINARALPDHPSGEFAVCLRGADVNIPPGAKRVDLPVKHARVLLRVELGSDLNGAVALQKQFTMKALGTPQLPAIPKTPVFDIEHLPGVEAFDAAEIAMDSENDSNPGMEMVSANARAIGQAVKDPSERARIDDIIRKKAWADFGKAGVIIGHGTPRNGWVRPSTAGVYGDDWLTRALVNFGGIWANTFDEVIYYKCALDESGDALDSGNSYRVTFPKDALPAMYAKYFWSVIAVDNAHMRVLPNPMNRFLINNQSKVTYGDDGSLTLYFAPRKPADAPEGNWLPTAGDQKYRLTFRFYGPQDGVKAGTYWPPALSRIK